MTTAGPNPATLAGGDLASSDVRLRRMIDALPAGAAFCDGERIVINAEVERMTGYAREELATFDAWFGTLFGPEAARVRTWYEADRAAGFPAPRVIAFPRRDGRVIHVEFRAREVDGGTVWMLYDVTARELTEAELRRQALVVETLHDAVLLMDEQFRIQRWNAAAERLFGWPAAEVIGRTPEFFHDPVLAVGIEDEIRRTVVATGRWAGELPFRARDGRRGTADVVVVQQRAPDGRLVGHVGVNRDVTERQAAIRAVRESEAELRAVFGALADVVVVLDADARYLRIAPTSPHLLVRPREELLGRTVHEVFPPEVAAPIHAVIREALRTQQPVPYEYPVPLEHGVHWFAAVASPLAGADRVVWVARDVTEQRNAQETLRQREEQLARAQKMEAVGRLAGGVAHDFNNLLTVIRANTELLASELPVDHPSQLEAQQVLAAAERAASLTRQLLAFSRQQPATPRIVDANAVVRDVERMLVRIVGPRVQLAVALEPDAGHVLADAGQLEQVLMNLAVNARDAMEQGGVLALETAAVTIGGAEPAARPLALPVAGLDARPGRYVLLRVTDEGTGMDEATMHRMFEPFFTTKPQGRGTGLGLATVYGIIAQAGGHLRVRSAPGEGTTMEVLLPAYDAPAPAQVPEPKRARPSLAGPAAAPRRATVLLVEDEAAVRSSVRRILERAGHTVLEARHGGDALLLWQRHRADVSLVLTDVVMPEVSGPELARALRADAPTLPVLFMSGYTGEASVDGLATGEWLIGKPFDAAELLRRVEEALAGTG